MDIFRKMSILLPDEIYQQEDNDFIQSINPRSGFS